MTLLDRLRRFPGRDSWLAARRSGVGSSDAAAILGLSTWHSPFSLWCEKVGLIEPNPPTEWTEWGSRLEPLIVDRLSVETGVPYMRQEHTIVTHAEHPTLFCTPDALTVNEDGEIVFGYYAAEVKNVSAYKRADWDEGVPLIYECQVQHAMDCMGLAEMHVGALFGGNEFLWTTVERDDGWIEMVRPVLLDFARRVAEEDPPEVGADDARALAEMYDAPVAESVSLDGGGLPLTWRYHAISDSVKRRKRLMDEIKNDIRSRMGNAEIGVLPDGRRWTWKPTKKGTRVLRAPGKEESDG